MKAPEIENVLEPMDFEAEQLGTEPVIVHIPQYSGMQERDTIQLVWSGSVSPAPASEAVDPNLVFKIDVAGLERDNSSVKVSYVVLRS
ncbi:hypothetical protein PRtIB026_A37790 [Pseudomonas sp. RtIB026]|uniref:hypothetical protein n=1 Tax=Pseudomonas sp. RtIB026 TaxID=2749999 RepID=UPI001944FCF9|nr:hypothetical protein [Pseudomonas sp. RtIB026]BCJ06454.1 hypothetical protein PRtIB026_A37790 [Pseudomonas sp. RtIB026]